MHILKLLSFFVRTNLCEISEKRRRNIPGEQEQWDFLSSGESQRYVPKEKICSHFKVRLQEEQSF